MNHRILPALAIVAGLGATAPAAAQFSDDFSNGTLSGSTLWSGDTAHFTVNASGELQLQAPDAGLSTLRAAAPVPDSARWALRVRLDFAPSAANRLRIYLQADHPDLAGARGYFLEIGENGTADAIRLFRQDGPGTPAVALLAGTPGLVANEPVTLELRVERSAGGRWELWAAAPGNPALSQGTATDSTYAGADSIRYFGLQCLYTATRRDKFYFDNISLTRLVPDTHPPTPLFTEVTGPNALTVTFDEALDLTSAVQTAHYEVSTVGSPDTVVFDPAMPARVRLILPASLTNGTVYTVTVNGVGDPTGNICWGQQVDFLYLLAESIAAFDVVFTEIMFDPSPSAGLPDAEWVEIQNISSKYLDTKQLRLQAGSDTTSFLPAAELPPGARLVLTSPAGAGLLAGFNGATVLAASDFPGLNNTGEALMLLDSAGTVIDRVDYRPEWHTDAGKADGGWSLERRVPVQACLAGSAGWQTCPEPPGGTPGHANAAAPLPSDDTAPELLSVFPVAPDTLRLTFSEGVDFDAGAAGLLFSPPPAIDTVLREAERTVLTAVLTTPLLPGVLYALTATAALRDCAGNSARPDTVYFGLPQTPAPGDLAINEILFDPATGGARYVELYNRGTKLLGTDGLFWTSAAGPTMPLPPGILLPPKAYTVFATDTADVSRRFSGVDRRFLFRQTLPALPDDRGDLTLFSVSNGMVTMLDSLAYAAWWHNPLLSAADREGIALERLAVDAPTNDPSNWTSAVPNGTPTRANSQQLHAAGTTDQDSLLWIPVARLSPDGDGREDFLEVHYRLPGPGYAATVAVFDAAGTTVWRRSGPERVSDRGFWRWHGDRHDGQPAAPGLYVFYVEFIHPGGTVHRLAKPVALVKNL